MEPKCRHCNDTGEIGQQGYLDCTHCDVAEERAALEVWMASLPRLAQRDLEWEIYKHGREAGLIANKKVVDEE